MADLIKCPVCGHNNFSDQEFCLFCQSRLEPLTGPLKGADAPIKPGQAPTKKNTAELEPILPQWLRDARTSARDLMDDGAASQIAQPSQNAFTASESDLLAGLQSQTGGEEDEIPDWLTSITGDSSKPKKPEMTSSEVRWVELGGANDFSQAEPSAESPDEKDDISDWLRDANGEAKLSESPSHDSIIRSAETPDWLRQMSAEHESKNGDIPAKPFDPPAASADWLHQLGEDASQNSDSFLTDAEAAPAPQEEPDWLSALRGSQEQTQNADSDVFSEPVLSAAEAAELPSNDGLPDWMKDMPSAESEQSMQVAAPAWLKDVEPLSFEASDGFEVPAWLSAEPSTSEQPVQEEQPAREDLPLGDIPNWLKAAAPQSSIYSDLPAGESQPTSDQDWLNSFKPSSPVEESPKESKPKSTPAFTTNEAADAAAFTADEQSNYNMDALFTDMPDWLSNAVDEPSSASKPAVSDVDSLTPGELPSWVQAMRPIAAGVSQSLDDQTFESRGALAGLQGVLPAVPGFIPASKPKGYSIKLQASEEQQAQASILEQILAAETAPDPIASFSSLPPSRGLRWSIAFILIAVLGTVAFLRTQIFALPAGVPAEISGALLVSQAISEGAPVLVAFDYEPARVGELEAAASPIFNQMRSPNYTFISTNETGAILAERFISGPLADTDSSGIQRLNLGYLPGGQMGIRAFAQDPAFIFPQLEGITTLSQFAALIILTDNANSARAWIEQTSSARGTIPVVVISSAQSAPMIQPYYDSQQISGLVSGLYGSAVFEQNMSGGSGISRNYWDAYSIGMLLATALIVSGGLFSLAAVLRDRAASREEK
jgi:hypothetical protein